MRPGTASAEKSKQWPEYSAILRCSRSLDLLLQPLRGDWFRRLGRARAPGLHPTLRISGATPVEHEHSPPGVPAGEIFETNAVGCLNGSVCGILCAMHGHE